MATSKKKGKQPASIRGLRRKRQVEGRRHDKRVDVYFSTEEKDVVRRAAQKMGVSLSQYCTTIALQKAKDDLA